MKKWLRGLIGLGVFLGMASFSFGADLDKGKKLFLRHCSFCHPGGKNVIRPSKNLKRKTLIKNGITSPEDIVQKMRRPGPGMPVFSERRISPEDALSIAHYVWETFKDDEENR